jgi:hypothetical protein
MDGPVPFFAARFLIAAVPFSVIELFSLSMKASPYYHRDSTLHPL